MRVDGHRCVGFALGLLVLAGCGRSGDQDREGRAHWKAARVEATKAYLREVLNGSNDIQFYDGWYPLEADAKTNAAWRWMSGRGILRLRTAVAGDTTSDMELHMFGWVPHESVGFRTLHMELSVNGHVLEMFHPPKSGFEHVVTIPRWMLGDDEFVDFVIAVANTAKPAGDWRDLGFATTGFHWKKRASP